MLEIMFQLYGKKRKPGNTRNQQKTFYPVVSEGTASFPGIPEMLEIMFQLYGKKRKPGNTRNQEKAF